MFGSLILLFGMLFVSRMAKAEAIESVLVQMRVLDQRSNLPLKNVFITYVFEDDKGGWQKGTEKTDENGEVEIRGRDVLGFCFWARREGYREFVLNDSGLSIPGMEKIKEKSLHWTVRMIKKNNREL
jgi:hypothetical protein